MSFGVPLGDFLGCSDVFLSAVGCLGGPAGVSGTPGMSLGHSEAISGIFREIRGWRLAPFLSVF